jgi:hypothetical protein
VVAAHPADPLVEDHLAAAVLDLPVQRPVGLLVQRQPRHVRAPHQATHAHAALDRLGEQLGHRRTAVAQQLVGVTPPVGEEEVVAGVERPHLLDQPVEVGAAVHQGLREVARRPSGQRRVGVSALLRAEQPELRILHEMITSEPADGRKRPSPVRRR